MTKALIRWGIRALDVLCACMRACQVCLECYRRSGAGQAAVGVALFDFVEVDQDAAFSVVSVVGEFVPVDPDADGCGSGVDG